MRVTRKRRRARFFRHAHLGSVKPTLCHLVGSRRAVEAQRRAGGPGPPEVPNFRELVRTLGFLSILWIASCTSPEAPPALGGCVPTDASRCSSPSGGSSSLGGGSSTDDGGAGTTPAGCPVSPGESLCLQCAEARCCVDLNACESSALCRNLFNCETAASCATSADCVAQCEAQYQGSTDLLNNLTTCLGVDCTVCTEEGIGDPCSAQAPCIVGLSCNGLWCTKACAHSSDCAGIGPSGENQGDDPNVCMQVGSGDECVPTCITNSDCFAYPGTYCRTATSVDLVSVQVCTSVPEAGSP